MYYFDYKYDTAFFDNDDYQFKETDIFYKSITSPDYDLNIIQRCYIAAVELISTKSYKTNKNEKMKLRLDEAIIVCKKMKTEMLNLFKRVYVKSIKTNSGIYKLLKKMEVYHNKGVMEKLEKNKNKFRRNKRDL